MELKEYFIYDYYCDINGNIYSKKSGELKRLYPQGFLIYLYINGKTVKTTIGRFVLICWKPRIDFIYLKAKHIDGNNLNNKLENLKWI